MKKSHRKDVIIARIIFAFMMLVLIILIVVVARVAWKSTAGLRQQQDSTEDVTESEKTAGTESETYVDDLEQWATDNTETEETETQEPATEEEQTPADDGETAQTILRAQYSVNVRSGPATSYSVIGGIEVGREVVLLEEDEYGWGYIQDGDLTGYVYLEYFLIVE
jgi:uncharacterized protein YgiM (DUF1202 family)